MVLMVVVFLVFVKFWIYLDVGCLSSTVYVLLILWYDVCKDLGFMI